MGTFQITESALPHLIDAWRARATVVGPRADDRGEVAFAALGPSERPALGASSPRRPPTRLLTDLAAASPRLGPLILFGLRPCDAAAIAVRRAALERAAADPLPPITVVTLACARPRATCFCSLVGGGPGDERGADVVASDLGGDLVMVPRTAAGEALIRAGSDLIAELGPAEAARALELVATASEPRGRLVRADLPGAAQACQAPAIWAELDRICLECEVCVVLCPAAADDPVAAGTTHWLARLRRMVEPTGDRPACVGCGRCVRFCPAGIDLRAVLREQELAAEFCDPP